MGRQFRLSLCILHDRPYIIITMNGRVAISSFNTVICCDLKQQVNFNLKRATR